MAQILVRDLEPGMVARLKAQAKRHGRSLQGEVKLILISAADWSLAEARAVAARWRRRLAKARVSDSAALIREDRRR